MEMGTWWARKQSSTGFPSTSLGPVQPLGERNTIMGQRGRVVSPVVRACCWMRLISRMAQSRVAAICWCIFSGSLPSTKRGSQPQPRKNCSTSSWEIREKMVGLAILKPFKCRMGSTAPSVMGFRNLLECQDVARGPVSASPSPTTQAAMRSGLSATAPKAWAREYPSSPPSLMEPGVSGATWLGTPPGKENCLNSFRMPSSSWVMLG